MGERSNWIGSQRNVFLATPDLEEIRHDVSGGLSAGLLRVQAGSLDPLQFCPLGFADKALSSWTDFKRLRSIGLIGPEQRFQISLPTPLGVVARYVSLESQAAVEGRYRQALIRELVQIVEEIPPDNLAIQWDVAIEFAVLEGLCPVHFSPAYDGIVERLLQLSALVPRPAELGFHLCYTDVRKQLIEPRDMALMVQVANAVAAKCPRGIDWVHMPVPRNRRDAAYFRPLEQLKLPTGCGLFLGVVHMSDGIGGAGERIAAAQPFTPSNFGIATECGLGRHDPRTIVALLQLHADLAG